MWLFPKMKLLLVPTPNDLHDIWRVEDGVARKMVWKDYSAHTIYGNTKSFDKIYLPYEIVEIILDYLMEDYVRTFNFDLASDLLQYSKCYSIHVYQMIYYECVDWKNAYIALCRTFTILEMIHDAYFTEEGSESNSIHLLRPGTPGYGRVYEPWDFCFDIIINPTTLISDDEEHLGMVSLFTGYKLGTNIWLTGKYEDGCFEVTRMRYPLIIIYFSDFMDNVQVSESMIEENLNFKYFAKLLKFIYGENTGIYIAVSRDFENPFLSDNFIELF